MFAETREPIRPWTEADWSDRLQAALGHEVLVRYSRARRYVVRVQDLCQAPGELRRPPGRGILVRMNSFFAEAPPEICDAVAAWVRSGRRARRANVILDAWIQSQIGQLEYSEPRRVRVDISGDHHDLEPLVEQLWTGEFRRDFATREELPTVTWGRRGKSQSRHSLQLGIYDYHARVVRLHRVLDQPAVPEFFVSYVLFHEILHAALDEDRRVAGEPVVAASAARHAGTRHHGPTFRHRERAYVGYAAALRWERKNLPALIRSARTGRPLGPQGLLRF